DISGWQTSSSGARRFVFTSRQESYASWRNSDRTANCGVIGAAYFWNAEELANALRPPIDYLESQIRSEKGHSAPGASLSRGSDEGARWQAGTGMGEHVSHPIRSVSFEYDAGMYDPEQSIVIFYDFGERELDGPHPFAPEMPSRR